MAGGRHSVPYKLLAVRTAYPTNYKRYSPVIWFDRWYLYGNST
jgi:hypothetical protein